MVNNNTTNASFSVDVSYAPKQTIADINQSFLQTQESQKSAISSVFNFGKTPSTPFQPNLSNPNLLFIEILQDRLKKPYLKLNWESERQDIDSGQVTGFDVFRRLLPDTQAITHKNTIEVTSVIVDKLGNSIKKDALPLSYLNNNLANEQQFTTYVSSSVSVVQSDYVKIATINYSDYLKQQSNKLVSVTDRNIIQMSFEDKDIKYFQTYEYYIAYVTKVSLLVRPKSSTIVVTVDKNITPAPPISFLSKQVSEKEVYLSLTVNPSDDVGSYIIFKKAQNEISFKKVLESKINSNTSVILDKSIEYGKSYKYRVFLQDIFLNESQPKEIELVSSAQKATPKSRSNNLKIPIITALQDQNSDYINISISSNDVSASFYELSRRDLTIKERNFCVPSKLENSYGGNGWISNIFFINKTNVSSSVKLDPVSFVDSTTQKDHIYEYRVCGSDVYGNRSSYAFSMVLCAGKKSIRSPINLKSEVLRGSPFRVKISWDNDNLSQTLKKQLFQDNGDVVFNKLYYKVERRKKDEIYYASFPLTENQYIIDEAATIDAVTFNAQKTEDTHQAQPDMSASSTITTQNTLKRENNLPSFLLENDFYYYRIATISDLGDSSNPSPEFQLSTLPDLSEILNLQVKIINPKVVPPVIQLVWETQLEKLIPDYWLIERKINVATDVFSPVAKSYFSTEYYDKDVRLFKSYLYRITAFDSLGRKSKSVQIGIST